jgi:hypothetical protein
MRERHGEGEMRGAEIEEEDGRQREKQERGKGV